MSSNIPIVSVLLPAYNAEKYIAEAIESILNQTFRDFEFIIINDGSTDDTEKIILSFQDNRIRYIKNKENKGLIYTLNRGLELVRGEYIARMDADDISLPNRFALQVNKLKSNSNIIVCGSQILKFSEQVLNIKQIKYHTSNEAIKQSILFQCPFAHPTVMFKKKVLLDNGIFYDLNYKDAEDYKLWADLMDLGEFCNLNEALLFYRISKSQITQSNNLIQKQSAKKIRRYIFKKLYQKDSPNKIDISVLKSASNDKLLLSILILSVNKYNLNIILFSLHCFFNGKISFKVFLRVCKRFLFGIDPLI